MEALETRILARLGIADPYAPTVPLDAERMSETERAAAVAADHVGAGAGTAGRIVRSPSRFVRPRAGLGARRS